MDFFFFISRRKGSFRKDKGRPGARSLPRCRTALYCSIFREGSESGPLGTRPGGFRIGEIFRCALADSSQTLPRPHFFPSIGSRVCNEDFYLELAGRGSLIYLPCSIGFVIHPFCLNFFSPFFGSYISSSVPVLLPHHWQNSHHLPTYLPTQPRKVWDLRLNYKLPAWRLFLKPSCPVESRRDCVL